MLTNQQDTIAAIATAPGSGGVAIIRISGPSSLGVLQTLLARRDFAPRMLNYGWVQTKEGEKLDQCLAVYMPAPHSFTGEDIAEIHCHGGKSVTQAVLEAALGTGCRLAEAGEFTRRAYLNGRMDLSQAEAVAEMISAPTQEAVRLARNKLQGQLALDLAALRQKLDHLRASLFLAIDFPDEAEEALPDEVAENSKVFMSGIGAVEQAISKLIHSYERAKIWREGALSVLAGQVNAGKSSLLNALLGRRRAIVSDTPGTTRDFIEESISIEGLPVRLVDTAGLRAAPDSHIEAEGIALARNLLEESEAILLVQDILPLNEYYQQHEDFPHQPVHPSDFELWQQYGASSEHNKIILVLNKADECPHLPVPEFLYGCPCIAVSARNGDGMHKLCSALHGFLVAHSKLDFAHEAPPTLRQVTKLKEVLSSLALLRQDFTQNIPAELISVHLDSAASALADVTGASGTEEILDIVFSEFCVGK